MKINIKATGMSLTPAISDYVNKKISGLQKFAQSDTNTRADVEVEVTTKHHHESVDHFRTEVNFFTDAMMIRAEHSGADLYMTIDMVKDEIARQLISGKKKQQSLMRKGGQKIKAMLRGMYDMYPRGSRGNRDGGGK